GHERAMDVDGVATAGLEAELADRFEERQRFAVAHRAADLDDDHVHALADFANALLDLVGDVRDDLHGLAEVVAAAFLLDDLEVDAAGGEVALARGAHGGEALVVAEVEIGLGAVIGDEDFAVLERRHRPRIDVDVGIELEIGDADAARSQDRGQRRGGDAFPERGNDATGHEDKLGHSEVPEITYF